MNLLEYACIVFLFVGLWNKVYESRFLKHRPGFSEYENRVHASYKLSTLNAIVTTVFCACWWMGAPYVKQVANASLMGYFCVDYVTLMPYNYWSKHSDQKFHHILCMLNITAVMLLDGDYLEYGSHYSLPAEVSTIFANLRWFMLKKSIKTDPVVFSLNKTMFVITFFLVRILYGGINTYNIYVDNTVFTMLKALGFIYFFLNLSWSFKVYQLMPRVLQMTLLSFLCSVWAMFLQSPISNTLAKLEILIVVVSAAYWRNPVAGWRRNLDIVVTVSVFAIHTGLSVYLNIWEPVLCYLGALMFWKLGHVYDSNAVHLGVHVCGFIGTVALHMRLKT